MRTRDWTAAALITLGLATAGCGAGSAATSGPAKAEAPAKVEAIPGKDVKKVRLTEQAAKRIGVETATVTAGTPMTVPYSAVLYSPDGSSWVYTVTQPLTYVREKVVIANVGGDKGSVAFLSAGPAVGTTVVKTAAVELYGAELGVGK